MMNQRRLFYEELQKYDLVDVEYCNDEENAKFNAMAENNIPDSVEKSPGTKYYHRYISNLSNEEKKLFLMAKQLSNLNIIKNCLILFVILSIFGLIFGFISVFVH